LNLLQARAVYFDSEIPDKELESWLEAFQALAASMPP